MSETPSGLSELEYARKLCEDIMGWPSKGNIEMVGDCIRSISKAKRLTLPKAYSYLARAVKLAQEQSIEVNHFFFSNGEYMNVRPEKKATMFQPYDGCGKCVAGWITVDRLHVKRCGCIAAGKVRA